MTKEESQNQRDILKSLNKVLKNDTKLTKCLPKIMDALKNTGVVSSSKSSASDNKEDSLIKFKKSVTKINSNWHVLTRKDNFVASAFDNNGDYITLDKNHHYDMKFSGAQDVTNVSQFLRIANLFKSSCRSSRMLKDVRAYLHFNDSDTQTSESDEAESNEATSMSTSAKSTSESTASKSASQKSFASASHSASSTSSESTDNGNGITFSPK